jgi:hypothetical protein
MSKARAQTVAESTEMFLRGREDEAFAETFTTQMP